MRSEGLVSPSFVMLVSSIWSNKKIRRIIMKYADLIYFLSGGKNIKIKDAGVINKILITVVRFKTKSGAPNENIVQNHLNIALLNVF